MTVDINLSREEIRKTLLQEYAKLLEIDESQLDLSDTSFSSFLINTLSVLASNTLVYGSLLFNENSLVTAQLPENIVNWAKYIDYIPKQAKEAKVSVLVKIPLIGKFNTKINPYHKFYAENISFIPNTEYQLYIQDNIKILKIVDGIPYVVPHTLEIIDETQYLVFTIDLYQLEIIEEEFTVPTLNKYEFFSKTFNIEDFVTDVKVFVNNEEWSSGSILFADPYEKVFEWIYIDGKLKINFGNTLMGMQPSGIVKLIITTTKGSLGNVGPGTITKGDPLYSDNDPPERIDYQIINIESAIGGEDLEPIIDIKRNAPKSLSILKRVVSSYDYKYLFDIIYNDKNIISYPVLKRSDLSVNDIILYSIFRWNDEIVPTTSIYLNYDSSINTIKQGTVVNFEGNTWIIPFTIDINHKEKVAYYRWIPKESELILNTVFEDQTKLTSVISAKTVYDAINDSYVLYVNVLSSVDTVSIDQLIKVRYSENWSTISFTEKNILAENYYQFVYTIPRYPTNNVVSIEINTFENNKLTSIYSSSLNDIQLNSLQTSHIVRLDDGTEIISDIPVILLDWFDSKPDTEKNSILVYMSGKFLELNTNYSNRMMNTSINVKFAKTYGILKNLQKSTPDYEVEDIVYNEITDTTNIMPGSMFAISDPINPSDDWYNYAGYIAIWGGAEWTFFKPSTGTIIKNKKDNTIYYLNNRIWFIPNYKVPLQINVEVYTKGNIIPDFSDQIKENILKYLNEETGIEESIYLSKIIDNIHNDSNVSWVRIINPETDIIFRDILNNLNRDELITYVPEFIHTTSDNINIITIGV